MTEFTVWCLFGSLLFNIVGIHYKFFPPKKFKWWGSGIRIPSALKNLDTWNEGNNYIAFPCLITGSLFIVIALLPEIFAEVDFLSFRHAATLILVASFSLSLLADRHLKKMFDENGNRKFKR